jgi:hypothetical protein
MNCRAQTCRCQKNSLQCSVLAKTGILDAVSPILPPLSLNCRSDDALLHNEAIHFFVHNGTHALRVASRMCRPFTHNEVRALHAVLRDFWGGWTARGVFVAVENVSNMDGTVFPLHTMFGAMKQVFSVDKYGNPHLERRTQRVYRGLEDAGWLRCSGWRIAWYPSCTRSVRPRCSRHQVVRTCLLAPCSFRAS